MKDALPIDTIVCGDNVAIMREFPEDSVDLVVTSPPYDSLRSYGGHGWDFFAVATEIARVLVPGGVLVWVVADATVDGSESFTSLRQAIHFRDECGLLANDTMIYRTNKPPANCSRRYQGCWEYMFVFSKGPPSCFSPLTEPSIWAGVGCSPTQRTPSGELVGTGRRIIREIKVRDNIWHYDTGSGKDATTDHPAAFPEGLARDHILSWSREGQIVLDPFSGSGTTAKVARDLGRRYIGIEINPEYCDIARRRLSQQLLF